jgi:hypothetical protein
VFISVGKKLIWLLACSILTVYNGVPPVEECALTAAKAQTANVTLTATINTICFLSVVSPPFLYGSTGMAAAAYFRIRCM